MSERSPRLVEAARRAGDDPVLLLLLDVAEHQEETTQRLEAIGKQPISPVVVRSAIRSALASELWYPGLVVLCVVFALGLVLGGALGWMACMEVK